MQVRVSELLDTPGAHRESKVGCTGVEGELDLPSSASPQKKAPAGISVATGLPVIAPSGKSEKCTFQINVYRYTIHNHNNKWIEPLITVF